MNTLFQNACNRIEQPTPPIWIMRQAGRYHSHYQDLKQKYTFEELCKQPELAAEVARGPVAEFDYDLAILFSDILFVLEGLGLELKFNPGPKFNTKIDKHNYQEYWDWEAAVDFMSFQSDAVKATREALPKNKSLIGFVGGPWSVLQYGLSPDSHIDFKKYFLKEVIFPLLKENIKLQLEAGAEKVMIMDSGLQTIGRTFLREEYTHMLNDMVGPNVGYYCRGLPTDICGLVLDKDWGGVGIDSVISMEHATQNLNRGFIQGNFDENFMLLPEDRFKRKLDEFLDHMDGMDRTGWVCGLGHGINKNTPEIRVHQFIEAVRTRFS